MELYGKSSFIFFESLLFFGIVYSARSPLVNDNCVVTLTIPKDSIKSSCNSNDQMLRKMQALEGQFQRMRRELRLMENRLPKLVNDQNQYSKKVDRIEFTLSRTGTYYKRLEDRVHVLESRLSTDENTILDTQRRVTSPDTLMDPVRPYIVAEMQKYKDDVHQSVVNEIVPTIIASNNSFLSDLKDDILKQLKNDMLSTLNHHQYMNNTGKSPVIKRTDADAVKLTDKITVKQNDTSNVKALEVLARSLRRLNIGGNTSLYNDTNIKDDGSWDFDRGEWSNYNGNNTSLEVDNTTDSQIDLRDVENIIVESLNKIKQDILQSTRRNLRTMSQNYFDIQRNVSEITHNSYQRQVDLLNTTVYDVGQDVGRLSVLVTDLTTDVQRVERKVEVPLNDIVIDSKIEQKLTAERSSIKKGIMDQITMMLNAFKTNMEEQNRKINMTSNFVNIFKQTLLKHVNDSTTRVNDVRTETDRLAKKMEELGQFKLDNQVMTDKLTFLQDEVQSVVDSQLFTEGEIDAFKQSSNENVRENQNKIRELVNKINDMEFQINLLNGVKTILGKQEIQDNVTLEKIKVVEKRLQKVEKDYHIHILEFNVGEKWTEYNFTDSSIRNDCHKKKYVKLNIVSQDKAKYVGVQLCNPQRYKIFLGNSLTDEFYDIGDTHEFGEDHCQFVGATDPKGKYKVQGEFVFMHKIYAAYYRAEWNDSLTFGTLNMMRPTSNFYECGVKIP